jgi:competence/damage-inducible protein CinA-like protein
VSSAQIICVGDELLSGDTIDVHGSYLGQFLGQHGLTVERITLVADDYQAILGALAQATARTQLVIVTGGLGPTSDDRTRDALGLLVGQELEFDEGLWQHIQETLGRTLRGSNRQQAYRPALFEPLTNVRGTAPGLIADVGGCRVVALPGPPRELHGMIEAHADRILASLSTGEKPATVVTCFGIPESRLEDALRKATARLIATHPSANTIEWHTRAEYVRVVLRIAGAEEQIRSELIAELGRSFGEERLADGETTLAEVVVSGLTKAGVTLSVAESCTGGMLGAALTDIPGSSDVFWGSLVTYANSAKIAALGVKASTLDEYGAVSEETAAEMARSVRSLAGADLAISISGIAGPGGGTHEKPVGTVWIALDAQRDCVARPFKFAGDRGRVRRAALTEALLMIRSWLKLA